MDLPPHLKATVPEGDGGGGFLPRMGPLHLHMYEKDSRLEFSHSGWVASVAHSMWLE